MAVPKAQTLQQRFGFMDNDLKKPKHDDIILWLDKEIDSHLDRQIEPSGEWQKSDISMASEIKEIDALDVLFRPYLPERPPIKIKGKIWESPVYSVGYKDSKYIIGFIDIAVTYLKPYLWLSLDSYRKGSPPKVEWLESNQAFFEVKTEIPSMGELVRQIRMYQEYVKGKWFVVSPDDKFKDQLASQGISFIKYPL